MDILPSSDNQRRIREDGQPDEVLSQNRSEIPPRMLYVTVGQNDNSFLFSSSRVSPLDPNLNSVQYLPSNDVSAVSHQADIIHYQGNDGQHLPSSQFSSPQEELHKSTLINSNLVMDSLHSTQFESDSGNLVNHEPNNFNGYVNHLPVLNHLDNNLPINYANISSNSSIIDNISQIPLQNEQLEYINIDANNDPHFVSQLSNGQIIVKPNVNGRYLQQIINSDNTVINNTITESNNISAEIGGNSLGRIPENLLSELQDNDETLNRNSNLNKYLQDNQQFLETKATSKITPTSKTFKKYTFPPVTDNRRKFAKSINILSKKKVNRKLRDNEVASPMENQLILQNNITLSSDNNSDSLAVSPIELYENSSSYDFVPQSCDDNSALDDNGINYVNEDQVPREDYLVVDGGLYTLNGFKTQGFLIEQSSGDVMICQQLDGQLAIDQSMLDMKLNQMLNTNQDINLSLNYDDQIILDQNGRLLLKTEMPNDLEKNTILSNDVVFNHLNLPEELGQDLIMENEMNDIDIKMNIINDIGGEDIDSKFPVERKDIKIETEGIRKSNRTLKTVNSPQMQEVFAITDKTVLSRAWASLPATYLNINKINTNESIVVYGVFARKPIPERTQFGPLEGIKVISGVPNNLNKIHYCVKINGNTNAIMDLSDENTSNWMRFVRPADSEDVQNLIISEADGRLYFTTTKHIDPKVELRVWYGEEYANTYGFQLLTASKKSQKLKESELWPCYECTKKFNSSNELSQHLNEHEQMETQSLLEKVSKVQNQNTKKSRSYLNANKNSEKNRNVKNLNNEKNTCIICSKEFPRRYSLKRHMLTHKLNNSENVKEKLNSNVNQLELNQSDTTQKPKEQKSPNNYITIKEEELDSSEKQDKENTNNYDQNETVDKNSIKCSACPKVFSLFKDKLEHHMALHKKDNRSYICSQCPKKFNTLAGLTAHLKTHPWLKCPMCDKNFTVVVALREHVKIHCVNGFFTCKYCNKKFNQYRLIRKHIRAFHSEKKLPCPQCNKMFPAQDKLKMHLLRHSDHREFLCAHCGKQFKRRDKLTEHMKCVHEKQNSPQVDAREQFEDKKFDHDISSVANNKPKKFMPRVSPNDYHRFIYKCHSCLLGFKRRGMLVNHLAKRHPDVKLETVPELNLPILRTTRNYYCQYCCKVYKSSSKRKAHILKLHPGLSLPLSNRHRGGLPDIPGMPNPTYSQTVGSVTSHPHSCQWCHKQYASKAKLLQHQRKKHNDKISQTSASSDDLSTNVLNYNSDNIAIHKDNIPFSNILMHPGHNSQSTENPEIQLNFETIDPDDPNCYSDDMRGVKLANNYNYQNFQLIDDEQLEHVDRMAPTITMKLEKTPIIIDVSQLDEYRKSLKNKDSKIKSSSNNCILVNNLSRPQKKWSNNFPFISYPAR